MAVFLTPSFLEDLQTHNDAHFARRVLQKCLQKNGAFRDDADDHKYKGSEQIWIKYVSRANSAYRVIFIKKGGHVYFYRAGEHSVEDNLSAPKASDLDKALEVTFAEGEIAQIIASIPALHAPVRASVPSNRLLRNNPNPEIYRSIFGRRNLPHKDIWLVSPYISPELMAPTAPLGKLLYSQVEDGASVTLVTRLPSDLKIDWMERLEERDVNVFVYPKLHSKLYCFVLDENRRHERGLPDAEQLSSLLLIGSSNITARGLALAEREWNEELCYSIPDGELEHVEHYVTNLMMRGYDMKSIRSMRARGQLNKLEKDKW